MATIKKNPQPIELPHEYMGNAVSDIDASKIPAFSTYKLTDGSGNITDLYISDGSRWNH